MRITIIKRYLAITLTPLLIMTLSDVFVPEMASASQDSTSSVKEQPTESDRGDSLRTVRAVRTTNGKIRIDGILDESDWQRAPATTGFIQHMPDEGKPATERTTVQVIYDDEAIYVGIKAFDSQPDKIVGRLCRRDDYTPSDWIHIGFDSYNDKRTGFGFSVNPVSVKQDRIWYNDSEEDDNWDAVWDVATKIDGDGWTAEFSIPFNQLRYSNNGETTSWGFQVAREICRQNEMSLWNPVPRDVNQIVSLFGRLEGMESLPKFRNLEILPYAVGSLDSYGDAEDDPFRNHLVGDQRIGADIKYGITSDVTLNATINPDFGQVEQDPSEFNITAYETYFEERRPFFIEGSNLFQYRLMFGDDSREGLFYSRRIGRSPQLYPLDAEEWEDEDTDDFYEDTPAFTKILGAAKITGRTSNGWSIAILDALTDKEKAEVALPTGERVGVDVEPMTNYFVARAMKDFNDGRSTFGGILTSVARDIPSSDLEWLNRTAFTGGLDFSHRWHNDDYQITAKVMGSHVRGSQEAMLEMQNSSARYYQRPDAPHLGVDSTLTHMSGFASYIWGGKFAGGHWRYGIGYLTRSPDFEANDIGFMQYADAHLAVLWGAYREYEPGKILRQWSLNINSWEGWNYGGEQFVLGGNVNGFVQFLNYWEIYGGILREQEHQDGSHLRGGPSLIMPGVIMSWHGFETDHRKPLTFGYHGDYRGDDEGYHTYRMSPLLTIRPSGRFDMTLSPGYTTSKDNLQYVDEIDEHYILGHLDMKVFSITTRLNYTITPEMSVQFYGMPFIAAGEYTNFREVVRPHAENYNDRFAPFDYSPYDNPDFNFKQFCSNLVFRWEYSPGSTIFLVWSRGVTNLEEEYGEFSLGRDMDRLFSTGGDNTFLIKINKWFSL